MILTLQLTMRCEKPTLRVNEAKYEILMDSDGELSENRMQRTKTQLEQTSPRYSRLKLRNEKIHLLTFKLELTF